MGEARRQSIELLSSNAPKSIVWHAVIQFETIPFLLFVFHSTSGKV